MNRAAEEKPVHLTRVCLCVCLEERCLDEETYIKALLELNPSAEWVIKSVQH